MTQPLSSPNPNAQTSEDTSPVVSQTTTTEPVDNNNFLYQNYHASGPDSSTYSKRNPSPNTETINIKDGKEDYYNFSFVSGNATNRPESVSESNLSNWRENSFCCTGNNSMFPTMERRTVDNSKLNDNAKTSSLSSGPYIAISECISGNPMIDRENPTTPLNSLDPRFYDTPRSHLNIGFNLTNEQPYSPKPINIPTVNLINF